ncbi:MAG: DUF268 domain-containing protein [Desulfobacterales bacterium]|nr:DUF268 domain-containing protein [Desulfobacterales bacterium]
MSANITQTIPEYLIDLFQVQFEGRLEEAVLKYSYCIDFMVQNGLNVSQKELYNYALKSREKAIKMKGPQRFGMIRGPIPMIPRHLLPQYTMMGTIGLGFNYRDELKTNNIDWSEPGTENLTWTSEQFGELLEKIRNLEKAQTINEKAPFIQYASDIYLKDVFDKYSIENLDVVIIGSAKPYYEAYVAFRGGRPTTIEYRPINSNIEKLKTYTPDQIYCLDIKFDAAISYSSLEHSGLGLYTDWLDPNADLDAMRKIKSISLQRYLYCRLG